MVSLSMSKRNAMGGPDQIRDGAVNGGAVVSAAEPLFSSAAELLFSSSSLSSISFIG
jgi:hypothetical protein